MLDVGGIQFTAAPFNGWSIVIVDFCLTVTSM